ncbi:MAG: hypothetical protein J5944_00340 [Lentisphaeria bacterium]|nr:hypothetical protein [Lentisphaeria bacterium]
MGTGGTAKIVFSASYFIPLTSYFILIPHTFLMTALE